MKTTSTLLTLFILFSLDASAQDSPQLHLPDGAKARFGKGTMSEIAYSQDGTRLAVAGGIGIWIYNAQTGQELDLLSGHTAWVFSVSFSPDGTSLASGSSDRTVRLWDANTGEHLHTLTEHSTWVRSVSFSPEGAALASGSVDGTVRLSEMRKRENTSAPSLGTQLGSIACHSVRTELRLPVGVGTGRYSCGNSNLPRRGELLSEWK